MSRLRRQLPGSSFDLVVVGGGIHGLFASLEAASRGWSVALFERDDYGSGLSFNHQRTVHGGLRALQSGAVGKTRQQIDERRAWAVMAPHLLRPLPFLFPTDRTLTRSRLSVGTALRLYDWLGRGRNEGLPEDLHLPSSRIESRDTAMRLYPGAGDRPVTGAAIWHDYQVRHPDRLNWLVAMAAERAGAALFNYVEAVELLRSNGAASGVRVRRRSGETADVGASRVLICAGAGTPAVHAAFRLTGSPLLVRACSLLVNRPALDVALAARGRSGRVLTATPWSGKWLIGTFQSSEPLASSAARPSAAEIDAMIDEANDVFPTLQLRRRDVALVHTGLTPAVMRGRRAELMPDSHIVSHGRTGNAGVYSVIGVKFTTARLTALEALDVLEMSRLRRHGDPGRIGRPRLLPHGSADGAEAVLRAACLAAGVDLDDDVHAHLIDWYGTEAAEVLGVSAAASRLQRVTPESPVIEGEVLYATERAEAVRLADAVLRRTRLGTAGHPGRVALERAADVMTNALSWSPEQRAAEIDDVENRYRLG